MALIRIRKGGNTSISFSYGRPGEGWEVFPFPRPGAPLQWSKLQQRERLENLSIKGVRDREDVSGDRVFEELAEAFAQLIQNLDSEENKDLGLIPDIIGVREEGEIARILRERHNIVDIEKGVPGSVELRG